MGYLVIFVFFVFGRKWIFFFVLFFVFVPEMSLALGRKCYVRNWTVTKFCDAQVTFVFGRKWNFIFVVIFVYSRKWKMHLRSALHQTLSDYTLRQWFSNTQQSRFRTGCIDALKNSFTLHFWHKSSFIIIIVVVYFRVNRCAAPWPLAISDLNSVDSCSRVLASSWTLLS